jgi:hypothetical protein
MKAKQKTKPDRYESVKVKKEIVNLVREDKEKTGVAIGSFFGLAAIDKLKKNQNA